MAAVECALGFNQHLKEIAAAAEAGSWVLLFILSQYLLTSLELQPSPVAEGMPGVHSSALLFVRLGRMSGRRGRGKGGDLW